jgi:hypothetical protein
LLILELGVVAIATFAGGPVLISCSSVGTTKTMDNPGIANAIRLHEQISKKSYISSFMYEYGSSLNQGVMNRPLFEDAELQLQ